MNYADRTGSFQQTRGRLEQTAGYRRIVSLFDRGSFCEIDALSKSGDDFAEAVAGYGEIDGRPACAFSQNPDISGGAMSKAQAYKIKKVYELALKAGIPLVGIYDSVGGRLNEGADMLASFSGILLAANRLSGVVPQISLVLGPCVGTAAMVAAGADVVVMSPKGELTVSTEGGDGSPSEAVKLGVCQIAAGGEEEAVGSVRRLISLLPSNNVADPMLFDAAAPKTRTASKTSMREIIASVCDAGEFLELGAGFGTESVTGFARIGGTAAGVCALSGVLGPDSCSKGARFVRFCDSFSLPVVTFVDAEKFTTLREASKLSSAYSEATTAKITAVTGSACGPVYTAAAGGGANADYVFAWPDAVVSAVTPEAGAVLLWSDRLKGSDHPIEDRKKLIEEFRATRAGAAEAAAGGLLEDIVDPPKTREKIVACLGMLSGKRVETLPKKHADIQL